MSAAVRVSQRNGRYEVASWNPLIFVWFHSELLALRSCKDREIQKGRISSRRRSSVSTRSSNRIDPLYFHPARPPYLLPRSFQACLGIPFDVSEGRQLHSADKRSSFGWLKIREECSTFTSGRPFNHVDRQHK